MDVNTVPVKFPNAYYATAFALYLESTDFFTICFWESSFYDTAYKLTGVHLHDTANLSFDEDNKAAHLAEFLLNNTHH